VDRTLREVLDQFDALVRHDRKSDHTGYLRARLSEDWPEDDARTLRLLLRGELQRLARYKEAERLLLEEVEREPNEPFHSLCLAEHFHYFDVDLAKALEHVGVAITKARSDGKFLYQGLGTQARLAIETKSWPLLEQTLREMASYEHRAGDVDVFPETDFLSRIPEGVIDPGAIADYEARVKYLRSIGYSTLQGPA
jgi:hypothetical protein